ncbi:MAG: dCTP deaminase, partial [Rhizomicrobium sp.]
REEVDKGAVKFDPPLEDRQWGEASVDLRLGLKFTKFRAKKGVTFSMTEGISALSETGLWDEEIFEPRDKFGKRRSYIVEPGEFILALTHEHVWIPRHLIAMVEGRSTYARAGLSMHQTAPWIQPGWDGQITLEIRNSGNNNIALTPLDDMPCQLTFFQLTTEVPEKLAYGSRSGDVFQNQSSALPTQRKK